MPAMKAFLIDPAARTVTEVEYSGHYRHINALIGSDTFTAAEFNEGGDTVYVDDEGLLKGDVSLFRIQGYEQPLAGKGLVLGTDVEGDAIPPAFSLAELQAIVSFGTVAHTSVGLCWVPETGRPVMLAGI